MSPSSRDVKSAGMILVIDDDVPLRRSICELLDDSGYSTIAAADGADAIRLLNGGRVRPDLILLDLNMPDVDGFEVRRWLAEQPAFAGTPVVVVSAHLDITATTRLRGVNMVHKPFSPDALLARVRRTLERASRTNASRAD